MQKTGTNHIKALIDLLGDRSEPHASLLRDELARVMKEQPAELRDVIERDFNSSVPMALVEAMEEVCWEELLQSTARFNAKINPDLEEGLSLVTRFVNPAFHRMELSAELDSLASGLRPLLANCLSSADILSVMGRFFFSSRGFTVLSSTRDVKDVSFGRFLKKRRGSALCLACLYVLCAERFGLDAGVADLAGRIVVRLLPDDSSEPLFVDPLDQGKLLTLSDCRAYIHSRDLEWSQTFTDSLSSRAILRRFWANMIFILNKLRDERRLSYLRRYMDILKN